MRTTKYSRFNGPICFESNVFGAEENLVALEKSLPSSELDWFWASASRSIAISDSESKDRRLTRVDDKSVAQLIADFRERDSDGYGRSIVLMGCEKGCQLSSRTELALALEAFTKREEGPLLLLVIQVGDSPEYVYVPHQFPDSVSTILQEWQVDASDVEKELPYERLNLLKLETVGKSILDIALGDP